MYELADITDAISCFLPMTCQCPLSGYCQMLGRHMNDARHRECQIPAYHEMFLREAAAGKYLGKEYQRPFDRNRRRRKRSKSADETITRTDCRHLGEIVDERKGELCGCKEPQKVYACGLHGECTLHRVFKKVPTCATCEDYSA